MEFDNTRSDQLAQKSARLHLSFSANGKSIIYCYIRKNACTSFKNMIVSCSPSREEASKFSTAMRFIQKFHTHEGQNFQEYDHSVFVVREPFGRVVSLYLNKFVQRSRNKDIFKSYAIRTGNDPEKASFQDFMIDYISQPMDTLDPHVQTQWAHLLPARYSDAILIDQLHATMTGIVGKDLADRYFLQKVNSTSSKERITVKEAWSVPSCELHAIYRDRDVLPSPDCLLSPELRSRIADIYADDIELFDAVRGEDKRPRGLLTSE